MLSNRGSKSRSTCTCRPAPRSAHQAVVHKKYLYLFGGELTSPNQVSSRALPTNQVTSEQRLHASKRAGEVPSHAEYGMQRLQS